MPDISLGVLYSVLHEGLISLILQMRKLRDRIHDLLKVTQVGSGRVIT